MTAREENRVNRVLGQFGAHIWFSLLSNSYVVQWGPSVINIPVPERVLITTTAKRWPIILAHLEEWGEW